MTKKSAQTNIDSKEHIPLSEIIEECLVISDDNKLIQNRTFNNLDWTKKNFKELIFKNFWHSTQYFNFLNSSNIVDLPLPILPSIEILNFGLYFVFNNNFDIIMTIINITR